MVTVYTRQTKCCYTIFHVSNSIIIFVIKYIQSVYYVTLTRILYNIPLYCAKMFIYVQIKRTRSDIATTVCAMAELFVISRSYLFATLIDNKTCSLKTEKRKRERESLYHKYVSDLLKYETEQLWISLLIKERRNIADFYNFRSTSFSRNRGILIFSNYHRGTFQINEVSN